MYRSYDMDTSFFGLGLAMDLVIVFGFIIVLLVSLCYAIECIWSCKK